MQKYEDGEILPIVDSTNLEQPSIATTSASEPATEEGHSGKKKKGKSKKPKKLSPYEGLCNGKNWFKLVLTLPWGTFTPEAVCRPGNMRLCDADVGKFVQMIRYRLQN